jgi:hypothetical protein
MQFTLYVVKILSLDNYKWTFLFHRKISRKKSSSFNPIGEVYFLIMLVDRNFIYFFLN